MSLIQVNYGPSVSSSQLHFFNFTFLKFCADFLKAISSFTDSSDSILRMGDVGCEYFHRLMEEKGAPPPGSVTLTSGLSKPFKRFEQYPNILRELERHIMVSKGY